MITQTRTHVLLELSNAAYDEIKHKLLEAGYSHAILDRLPDHAQERIDMNGIAVISEKGIPVIKDRDWPTPREVPALRIEDVA